MALPAAVFQVVEEEVERPWQQEVMGEEEEQQQ